eukprot:TRINITY_DN1030_c0_g2_i4.p1 TRINITY_DN1030_c0_g2~~TRINITY_DN1030_c0_g2_i4.p1  ORF type:complete len:503 (-),score=93.55 TRINITY_DN1030_c0_g2_i4:766-2076(-)
MKQALIRSVPGATWSEQNLQQLISIGDLDGNGTINFNDFCFWFEDLEDDQLSMRHLCEFWSSTMLGIKDPKILFKSVWKKIERYLGRENMHLPSEIMWLGGAPGSGKGTMTPFIKKERSYSTDPIVMSSLLDSPSARAIKSRGGLVGDFEVLESLLRTLFDPKYKNGVVVDGFPRTECQVTCVKLLYDEAMKLHKQYYNPRSVKNYFPRPLFRITVLFVDENESIRRQLSRGRKAIAHNRAIENGEEAGELYDIRETDTSSSAARKRYQTFKNETLASLNSLQNIFTYNIINAMGTIDEVAEQISKELAYQSSLDLSKATFDAIRDIPTSDDLINNARRQLVSRLDSYQEDHHSTFIDVIDVIKKEFIPVLQKHSLSGDAIIVSHDPVFKNRLSSDMVIDIFTDRHFQAVCEELDSKDKTYRFRLRFQRPQLFSKW